MTDSVLLQNEKKHNKGKEFGLYLVAVVFYTMMTGAVGSYRSDYLINATKAYRFAIDLCIEDRAKYNQVGRALYKKMEEIQPKHRLLDRGFFYKPSNYKNK